MVLRVSWINFEVDSIIEDIKIQVDGGINDKTASKVIQAGANVLVAGSAIFKGTGLKSYKKNIDILRSKA